MTDAADKREELELPGDVAADLVGVFGFKRDERPQDRAHAYLEAHRVRRGYSDTAMQCAAEDLCRRAMAAGMAMAGPSDPVAEAFKAAARYQDAAADALRAAIGRSTDAATHRASS